MVRLASVRRTTIGRLSVLRIMRTTTAGLALAISVAMPAAQVGQAESTKPAASTVSAGAQRQTSLPAGSIVTYAGGLQGAHGAPTSFRIVASGIAFDGPDVMLVADATYCLVWLVNRSDRVVTRYGRRVAAGQMAIVAGDSVQGFAGDGRLATTAALRRRRVWRWMARATSSSRTPATTA